jgi:putative Ca2+/H+ antiporter (TMEM165/GDT1 family)
MQMHFAIVIAVFPIIFLGELPDKTMFASLVLATHGKPRSVWLGAAGAFLVHVVIATTIGVVLFRLVPHRALDGVIAGVFLIGALLAFREARKAREEEASETELVAHEAASHRQTLVTAFVVIFLAEWGDLTQILTANLAARYHSPLSVGTGAVLALWSVAAIAVISGTGLPRFLKIATIRKVTVVVLLVLAGYSAWNAIR